MGCDVGESEMDGVSEGIDEDVLGFTLGTREGRPERDGLSEGIAEGLFDELGLSLGIKDG